MRSFIRRQWRRHWYVAGLLCAGIAHGQTPPAPPCAQDPNFAQFEFLVGEWEVFGKGQKSAEVSWQRTLNGCGLQQKWTSARPGGQNGVGLMTYSRLRSSPSYYYVGDQGSNTISDRAEVKSNDLTFLIRFPSPTGKGERTRRFRLTLQADGSILESSMASDAGGPWQPEFELVWRKK